jgi:hypothetical protein
MKSFKGPWQLLLTLMLSLLCLGACLNTPVSMPDNFMVDACHCCALYSHMHEGSRILASSPHSWTLGLSSKSSEALFLSWWCQAVAASKMTSTGSCATHLPAYNQYLDLDYKN